MAEVSVGGDDGQQRDVGGAARLLGAASRCHRDQGPQRCIYKSFNDGPPLQESGLVQVNQVADLSLQPSCNCFCKDLYRAVL